MKKIYHLETDRDLINYFSEVLGKRYHALNLEDVLMADIKKKGAVLLVGDFTEDVKDIKEILGNLSKYHQVIFYSNDNKLEAEFRSKFSKFHRKYHFKHKDAYSEYEILYLIETLSK